MDPHHHARSSAARFGGCWEDYWPLHSWFDELRSQMPDFRYQALRHHSEGIASAERLFGVAIINSVGRAIPSRALSEQHITEDLGRIPTVQDWLECLVPQPWMSGAGKLVASTATDGIETCDCQQPGTFSCGIPGILARIENGRLVSKSDVERCDVCCRYPSDAAAVKKLRDLGLT